MAGGAGLGALGGIYGGLKAANFILTKGISWLYGREGAVITPLWYKGAPYTAGLEGMRKDSVWAHAKDEILSYTDIVGRIRGIS